VSANALKKVEPATIAVSAWAEARQKELEPVLKPVGDALKPVGAKVGDALKPVGPAFESWMAAFKGQLATLGESLKAPKAAFDQWLAQSLKCLCLPFQKPITYTGMAAEDYPPPVYAGGAAPAK